MTQTRAWVLDLVTEHRAAVGNQNMVEYIIDSEVEIIPVPLAPVYAPGVMVWRQQIIPVIDIGKMLRPAETDLGKMTGVMILAYQQAPGEPLKHGALVLRSAPQTTSVSGDMACPLPESPLAWQSLALACFTEQNQAIPILDARQVFSDALREIYRTSQAAMEADAAITTPAWEQTTAGEAMADEPQVPDMAEPSVAEGPPTAAVPAQDELLVPEELTEAATDSLEVASENGEWEAEPLVAPKSQEHPESEMETASLVAEQPSIDTGMTQLDETETDGSPDTESPGPDVSPTMSEMLAENRDRNAFVEESVIAAELSPMEAEDAVNSTEPEGRGESDLSTTWVKPPDPASVSPDDDSRAETSVLFGPPEPVEPERSTPEADSWSEQEMPPLPTTLPEISEAVWDDSVRTGSDGPTVPDEDTATTSEFSGTDGVNDFPDIPDQGPERLAADADEVVTPPIRKRWALPRHNDRRLSNRRVKPDPYERRRPGSPVRTRRPELRAEPVDEKSLGNDAAEEQGKPSWKAWRK